MSTLNRGKFFSRQFLLVILTLFGGFWLVWNDKPLGELTLFAGMVLGFYQGASVYEKTTMRKLENKDHGNGNSDE